MTEQKVQPRTDPISIRKFIETVQRSGYDREFREHFIADPRATLRAEGFAVPDNIELVIVIDEPNKVHLTVPVFDDSPVVLEADDPLLNDRYAPQD